MTIEMVGAQSFDELRNEFVEAEEWLREIGFSTDNNRVAAYRKLIDVLVALYENEKFEEINEELSSYLNALYEANEIIFIHKTIGGVQPALIKDRIEKIVSGPDNYKDEGASGNRARNFAFELLVAGRFMGSGFVVGFDSVTDVVVENDGIRLLIECKRPVSKNSACRNVNRAIKQIKKRMRGVGNNATRGIVAIDAGRIINDGFKVLVGDDETNLNERLRRCVYDFIEMNRDKWLALRKKGVLGVMVRFSCMAINKENNMYTYCQYYSAFPFGEKGGYDYAVLSEIVGGLQR
ncbi:hypothetical protein [Alloalcanivorax profundimaris]|uniref:hypothetical protein n=1 Tax=Alloalcanivorax profundimaris TaxID=2735259 RepID=UPI00136B662A|nr:hypothetical protein [Alloalcanivorax profundimaris]MBF1803707.1 hypothetical protein [Alloalcanivorax profundimaris]MBM1143109.1 hypothetical protein [Alcanivorax sp. ZXX171]MCQ6261370.1 hypothetical protein [Alcanivorax sp. MM125-6]